jgi:hypothetical protein
MLYTEAIARRRVEQPTLSAIFPTLFPFLVELGSWDGKKLSSAAGVFHTCAQPLGVDMRVAGGCCDSLYSAGVPVRSTGWLPAR